MVREALARGGTYTMVCGQSYENKRIKAQADSIRASLVICSRAGVRSTSVMVGSKLNLAADMLAASMTAQRPARR